MPSRLVVLFDLDLTLVDVPADRAVLEQAIEAATDRAGLLDGIDHRGRTDRWIVGQVAKAGGLPREGLYERYARAYTPLLERSLAALPPCVLPGVHELLEVLASREKVVLGLATGGMRANAALKLRHAGLSGYFDPLRGGFGDDHEERLDMVRAAVVDCACRDGDRLVLIGDTERDMETGVEVGARPIGVLTGGRTREALSQAGAVCVFDDLTDTDTVMRVIEGRG